MSDDIYVDMSEHPAHYARYFIAIDEDLLMKLWMHDPSLVAPFARPFQPAAGDENAEQARLEALALLPAANDESKTNTKV